jgi:DNA polymerase I-like protein with 3'-5' exonuclease and polymerase domains
MAYIHDELQYAALREQAEGVGEIVKKAAATAGERLNMKIPIDADYVIGNSWADTH